MLVSDPSTDKSAASLDVNIGSMSDPKELPGLAHFCEHMCKYCGESILYYVIIQRSAKRYANFAKQDPGRARQNR